MDELQNLPHHSCKLYKFKKHYPTMTFVNAIDWLSHKKDPHPIDVSIIGDSFAPSLPSPVGRGFCPLSQRGRAREGVGGNNVMYFGKLNNLNLDYCQSHVKYPPHAINGLSENDFICAAKVDALFKI